MYLEPNTRRLGIKYLFAVKIIVIIYCKTTVSNQHNYNLQFLSNTINLV